MRISRFLHSEKDQIQLNGLDDHWLLTDRITVSRPLLKGISGMGIFTTLAGKIRVNLNKTSCVVSEDSFLVVNSGSIVEVNTIGDATPALLFFKEKTTQLVAAELFHKKAPDHLSVQSLSNHELVEHIHYTNASLAERLKLLIKIGSSCASFHQLKSDAIVRSIIEDLSGKNYEAIQYSSRLPVKKQTTRSDLYIRLSIARDWLVQSFQTPLDLDALSSVAMMSKAHFSRYFKKAYGITPYQCLMEMRMKWAEERITKSTEPIQKIAEEICFETLSSFSYQFKKWKGVSPRALRKQSQLSQQIHS